MVQPTTDLGVGKQQPFLRKTFRYAGGPATLRISALGLYRAFINGKRVGDDLHDPRLDELLGPAELPDLRRVRLLQEGDNTIDIWLGDGWYRSRMMWPRNEIINTWGDKVAAIAELRSASGKLIARNRRDLDQRPHANPQVRHLFRRKLRCPRRGRRGDRRCDGCCHLRQVHPDPARDQHRPGADGAPGSLKLPGR